MTLLLIFSIKHDWIFNTFIGIGIFCEIMFCSFVNFLNCSRLRLHRCTTAISFEYEVILANMDDDPVSQILNATIISSYSDVDGLNDNIQSNTTYTELSEIASDSVDAVACSTRGTGCIQSFPTCVSAAESSDINVHVSEDSMDSSSCFQSVSNNTRHTKNRKTHSGSQKLSESADKQSVEYKMRRERNNKFVRACREKTRRRHKEIEHHVAELLVENKELSQKVDALTSELTIYKNLFSSVGSSIPPEVDAALAKSVKQDK